MCDVLLYVYSNLGEIKELAGCDFLTISPKLLEQLQAETGTLERKLDAASAKQMDIAKMTLDEPSFRWLFNEDAMATEKLAQGIRNFAIDCVKLEKIIADKLQ